MKVTVDKAALDAAAARCVGLVATRQTIPILAHVALRAEAGGLTLRATDLERWVEVRVAATVAGPGACTVDGRKLAAIAKGAPDGAQLALTLDDGEGVRFGRLGVAWARARYRLATLPVEDFPEGKPFEAAVTGRMPAAALARLIDGVAPAMSTEETRHYLVGFLLEAGLGDGAAPEGGGPVLSAVATDGHRLHRASAAAPAGLAALPANVIVPRTAALDLARLGEGDELVELALDGPPGTPGNEDPRAGRLRATCGAVTYTTRLIDGTYPDWRRVVPAASEHAIVAPRAELIAALRRCLPLAQEVAKSRSRLVALEAGTGGVLTVACDNTAGEQAVETLDVGVEGAPPRVCFNGRYLLELLAVPAGARVRLEVTVAAGPARITDPDDPAWLAVLMPLRG